MAKSDLLVMSMNALEESQSEAEAGREMEIIVIIKKTGTVIFSLIVLCQVVISIAFCWRARKIK